MTTAPTEPHTMSLAHGSGDRLCAAARELAPALREQAAAIDAARSLPDSLVDDLRGHGFFRALQPRQFGGDELDLPSFVELIIELGRGNGSAAWTVAVLNAGWLLGGFPLAAQEDVWADNPDALVGSVFAPTTDVRPVDGGYRITGRWAFSSGADHSSWQILGGLTLRPGQPPALTLFLLPRSAYRIEYDWRAIGLEGTASNTVVVDDAFVPDHRTAPLAPFRVGVTAAKTTGAGALYRLPLGVVFPICLAAPVLGTALGAQQWWSDWTQTRTVRGGSRRAAEDVAIQMRLAEASAELDCARLLLERDAVEGWRTVASGGTAGEALRARCRRDGAYVVELCARATDRLVAASGARALNENSPIHRAWRDVHAAAAHLALRWDDAAATNGRVALGLGFDNPFFD